MHFIIHGRLDGLNTYTQANRSNAYAGANLKKKNEKLVSKGIGKALSIYTLDKVKEYPIRLNITWYEPNRRRDIDNITFATKFIQDALVKNGIIIDDSQKYIVAVNHEVKVDKDFPRIEVEILDA